MSNYSIIVLSFKQEEQFIFMEYFGLILKKTFPQNLDGQVLKSVFQKFKNDENLEEGEEQEVIKFIDTFVTCTLDKEEAKKLLIRECGDKDAVAAKAVEIARTVNKHVTYRSLVSLLPKPSPIKDGVN